MSNTYEYGNITDIKIRWSDYTMAGEWQFTSIGDLEQDGGLATAAIISLFTDKRADDDDPLPDPDNTDRRGWWGDLTFPNNPPGDQYGSKLWLLERCKATEQNAERADEYIYECLQWMIEDEVAVKIQSETEIQGLPENKYLAFHVSIYKTDGTLVSLKFDSQWEETFNDGT